MNTLTADEELDLNALYEQVSAGAEAAARKAQGEALNYILAPFQRLNLIKNRLSIADGNVAQACLDDLDTAVQLLTSVREQLTLARYHWQRQQGHEHARHQLEKKREG